MNTAFGSGQPTPRSILHKLRGSGMGGECDHRRMLWEKIPLPIKTPKIGTITSEERQIVKEKTTLEKVTQRLGCGIQQSTIQYSYMTVQG